jgi:uncharacterized protein
MRLSGLHLYPIKSCGGVAVGEWEVHERGLRHDRRWMLVDENGLFISQRELPRMALIRVHIGRNRLVVEAPGMPPLGVPLRPRPGQPLLSQVQHDLVQTETLGEDADRWFSEFLRVRCRLVHLPDESVRPVDPDY